MTEKRRQKKLYQLRFSLHPLRNCIARIGRRSAGLTPDSSRHTACASTLPETFHSPFFFLDMSHWLALSMLYFNLII